MRLGSVTAVCHPVLSQEYLNLILSTDSIPNANCDNSFKMQNEPRISFQMQMIRKLEGRPTYIDHCSNFEYRAVLYLKWITIHVHHLSAQESSRRNYTPDLPTH